MTVRFTPEEDKFILDNVGVYGCTEMARQLTARFGVKRSHQSVSRHCKEVLHVELTNQNRVQYTEEHVAFLRKCEEDELTLPEMAEAFNARFGTNTTRTAMERACKRYGLFEHRRGLAMEAGKRNPFTRRCPIGSEMTSGGKVYVKVADDVKKTKTCRCGEDNNWREKKRFLYEQYYGEIPEGAQVIHLNGNKADFAKENLYAITPQINMMLAANRWFFEEAELTRTAIKYCELFYALKNT